MSSMKEDDYTDYSCSTCIERLARDVETLLRSWHVDNGSDRHVSIDKEDARSEHSHHSVPLIRSERLIWALSLSTKAGRVSLSCELELALWDCPSVRSSSSSTTSKSIDDSKAVENLETKQKNDQAEKDNSNEKEDSEDEDEEDIGFLNLPHSLRRAPQYRDELPLSFLTSFSHLFGIGQHITLTPVQSSIPDELVDYLGQSIIQRHGGGTDEEDVVLICLVIGSTLSSWLQTALNCAVNSCLCCMPVFGVWGDYPSDPHARARRANHGAASATDSAIIINGKVQLYPPWMHLCRKLEQDLEEILSPSQYNRIRRKNAPYLNQKFIPPLLVGRVLPLHSLRQQSLPRKGACFTCYVLPGRQQSIPLNSRLSMWGSILLKHCTDNTINLWGARHVYSWMKFKKRRRRSSIFNSFLENAEDDILLHGWRKQNYPLDPEDVLESCNREILKYQSDCRRYALSLLESFACATPTNPIWGPEDDPIASVHATVTWNGPKAVSQEDNTVGQPLWTFPLKMRSTSMSTEDWKDVEESVERTILDPYNSASFVIQTYNDNESLVASLAGTQRCVLAAYIRTATLPDEALLVHLIDEDLIETWDNEAGNVVAQNLATCANISRPTQALVAAMDWNTAVDDLIRKWEAEEIITQVMDGSLGYGFPSPPEGMPFDVAAQPLKNHEAAFAPMLKAAPVGRLLSFLFVRMGQLRSACSMALVWSTFVNELRARWEAHEGLPNMSYVPGIDRDRAAVGKGRVMSSICVKADFSAVLHCAEPDPDDQHCLIGQKLQVFNLCIETHRLQEEKQAGTLPRFGNDIDIHDSYEKNCDRPPSPIGASSVGSLVSSEQANKIIDETNNVLQSGELEKQAEDNSSKRSSSDLVENYEDCDTVEGVETGMNVSERLMRSGARCPVYGANLLASGDQIYAPYLQRPIPLTDDVIVERKLMLAPRSKLGNDSVRGRLEIAFRYQKPKLLSDMRAFKAANPGSVFQDFVSWYGNPGDPLNDYKEISFVDGAAGADLNVLKSESVALKLDKASEAIYILKETRDFWSRSWDQALPQPASEQQPLFDVTSMVEMALDYLETMHPAILLNQVMAVNLSTAYFVLLNSANDALHVPIVKVSFDTLREKIEHALDLLSQDVTNAKCVSPTNNIELNAHEGSSSFASLDAISACDVACTKFSETEALTARAISLLHKFPYHHDLVENILGHKGGAQISLSDGSQSNKEAQVDILRCIQQRQNNHQSGKSKKSRRSKKSKSSEIANNTKPIVPTLREYLLRNVDESNPCQLSVRVGDELGMPDGIEVIDSGVLLALTKSFND